MHADVLIVGGGLGGVAAALAAARLGCTVVLTEESSWLGGQLTSQAVPPDEHRWIEQTGAPASYRTLRNRIREHYRRNYPLTPSAAGAPLLDPGIGKVSRLCHEPRAAVAAIEELLAPYRSNGQLRVLMEHEPVAVETDGDRVSVVELRDKRAGARLQVGGDYVLDATEVGDLLELGGVEHVIGSESATETGELHALPEAQPLDQQAITWCFAMDYRPGEDHTIDRPASYDRWSTYQAAFWPDKLLSWNDVYPISLTHRTRGVFTHDRTHLGGTEVDNRWQFRRILSAANFEPDYLASDITVVNWPQADYWLGPLVGVSPEERDRNLRDARELSLSLMYWMQTEAPRHDGGTGYPGLRLRGDVTGTDDVAMRPYIRESRRIRGLQTVTEDHVGVEARRLAGKPARSEEFDDSVGIGYYRIDLHPSTGGTLGPRTYVDVDCYPFQIPLGAMIPQRVTNLLPAAKNIATTHITNGCYRLHPVEWSIGEAAGTLAAYCVLERTRPHHVHADPDRLADYQRLLTDACGIDLAWPAAVFEPVARA